MVIQIGFFYYFILIFSENFSMFPGVWMTFFSAIAMYLNFFFHFLVISMVS